MRFIDLFAGLGGFHLALESLGHECVFASEINAGLRYIYTRNFPSMSVDTFGDIRSYADHIPPHDILCAGFPCQPFSMAGNQRGFDDSRGTLFYEIALILNRHKPEYFILENVPNLFTHDNGRTWGVIKSTLQEIGYDVRGTEPRSKGGVGFLSPDQFGTPQSRPRFYIVGRLHSKGGLPENPFPSPTNKTCHITDVIQSELTYRDKQETAISSERIGWLNHWSQFIECIPSYITIPSFFILADEVDQLYDVDSLPIPEYKKSLIKKNRAFFQSIREYIPREWVSNTKDIPPSRRILQWCPSGPKRDIWEHIIQFRVSGVRVREYKTSPTLTVGTTHNPILGPQRRYMTRIEGLRLQGFPDAHKLPQSKTAAFAAIGNAVHVGVVRAIAETLLGGTQ
jgi:DNA (cytosine-5)-methyltransferase 1